MRLQIRLLMALVCALVGTSCAPSKVDRSADLAALKALDEQWAATAAKNDVDGTVAFYADDAVVLPPNQKIASDKTTIRATWVGMLGPKAALAWKVTKGEVASSGELGYLYGTYSLTVKDAKAPVNDTGKFVEIWKKQADGKWKCVVDTYNSDLPANPPPPPPAEKKKRRPAVKR